MGQLVRSTLVRSSMRRSAGASSSGTVVTPPTQADWDPTLARYFFVDYDAGSDASLGYIDAAPGTVFAAGAVATAAIKTFTRLMQIVPLLGNDRILVVLIKARAAGATYLDADGVTQSVVDWSGLSGYKLILRRGSTDLTNSVADRLTAGFVTALAGPNGDGSFTALAGASITVWSVAGTPFGAEPANTGNRVRFTGNVTAGLANVATSVQINTTSQITASIAVSAPAVGDTFFLEKAGVAVAQWIDASTGQARTIPNGATLSRAAVRDVGIRVTSALAASLWFEGGTREIAGCEQDSTGTANVFRLADCEFASISAGYNDETNTIRAVGTGVRLAASGFELNRITELEADVFVHAKAGGAPSMDRVTYGSIFTAAYLGSGITMRATGAASPGSGNATIIGSGTGGGANKTRCIGQMAISSCGSIAIRGIDFNTPSNALFLTANGANGGTYVFDNLTGTAAANFGINCAGAIGCLFLMGRLVANTVTGPLGDITCDLAVLTHAGFTRTNVWDLAGNRYIGTAGEIVGKCARVTAAVAGLVIGDLVRKNGTTAQVVAAQADTLANAHVDGVMVSSPANGAVGYMATPGSGTPSITFAAAPTAGAIGYLSATTAKAGTTTAPVLTGTQQAVKIGDVVRVSGSNAECTFLPDLRPENTFEVQPIGVAVSNAAAAFSATQSWLIATGTYSADRAFTLEAISTLSVNTRRIVSDFTTAGAFNILLTPNAADSIDGAPAGTALAIPAGSKATIELRAMPSGGWKVM